MRNVSGGGREIKMEGDWSIAASPLAKRVRGDAGRLFCVQKVVWNGCIRRRRVRRALTKWQMYACGAVHCAAYFS